MKDLDFAADLDITVLKTSRYTTNDPKLHDNVGLKITNNKTKVMRLNSNIKTPVKINKLEIEDVDTFSYLGGVVTSAGSCDEDISDRLGKAKHSSED